ncbi:MAG: hypothetical protein NZ695_06510 [Dehalococcoidia bacterium]|nr:hypothetical protein [Dehalococcoidia bacterium]MDW8008139.1 hypothetical protein [Chloroflexota bacterium]
MRLSDPGAVEAIAEVLGAQAQQAPFQVPRGPRRLREDEEGEPVCHLALESQESGGRLLVTLWPTLGRVDVRLGNNYWVLKGVEAVDLYPGVEVLFRRNDPPAFLFVSVKGRVAMVA